MNNSKLPRLMLISSRGLMRPNFEAALESALCGGARGFQLREDLPLDELHELATRAARLCRKFEARLILNNNFEIARAVAASGCLSGAHWKANAISEVPRNAAQNILRGVSVHTVEEAQRAHENGADYLQFGSVFPTQSHPGAPAAGLEGLRAVCDATPLPVFAVGGIDKLNARSCLENGAHGVAVIRAVWQSEVEIATRDLIASLAG